MVAEKERLLSYYTKTCCKIDEKLASIADLSGSRGRFCYGSKHELLRMRTRLQNELFDLKDLFELPTGETVRIQAHLGNLALSDVESLIDSESLAMKRMSKSYPILKATQIRIAKSILDILICSRIQITWGQLYQRHLA